MERGGDFFCAEWGGWIEEKGGVGEGDGESRWPEVGGGIVKTSCVPLCLDPLLFAPMKLAPLHGASYMFKNGNQ